MWDEERVRNLAGRQHGLLSRSDLLDLGVNRHELQGHLSRSRIEGLHPGVYYFDSVPATWKTAVLAGAMAAGPEAVVSHRTAARLWNFDAIYGRVIEVTVPYLESPVPAEVIVHRTRRERSKVEVEGIPITTAERTLFDLAPMVPARTLEKAGRSAIRLGLTTVERMDAAVGRLGGRGVSGTRRMRWLIGELADDLSASVSEIDLKHLIVEAPVPRPIQQFRIKRPGGSNAYPDFAWPDLMKIVEADGFGAHGTPDALQEDLARQNELMDLGWEIRRFTATQIKDDPILVRNEIIRFINSRSVRI